MSLLYSVVPKGNPQNSEAGKKYYLQTKIRGRKTHRQILAAAAKNTTINAKEMELGVSVFLETLLATLADGFSAEVEGLGTFTASIQSHGADTEVEATPKKVKKISLAFRAKPEVYKQVNDFRLQKYTPGSTL